jgi:hypothetical protein
VRPAASRGRLLPGLSTSHHWAAASSAVFSSCLLRPGGEIGDAIHQKAEIVGDVDLSLGRPVGARVSRDARMADDDDVAGADRVQDGKSEIGVVILQWPVVLPACRQRDEPRAGGNIRRACTAIPPESSAWTDVTFFMILLGARGFGAMANSASGMAAKAVVRPSAAASWMSLIGQ